MAKGRRTEEADEAWRPSKEDAIREYDDAILEEEELGDKIITSKEHTPSRASPPAPRKKPAGGRRKKQQHEDDAWKPTDEDLEDEELEVQEMVNNQLMEDAHIQQKPKKEASPKPKTPPRKKPVGRPVHQEDDEWKPEGEDLDFEEYEEEEEDSTDDGPTTTVTRTPPRKTKKRPAASSAGSPEQQRTKPTKQSTASPEPLEATAAPSSPKHRLTSAGNKKPPEFLVKGQNEQAPFTFAAYRGEGMVMLAMNWKEGTPPDDFVGWVIEYTEPQSSKWWSIPVRNQLFYTFYAHMAKPWDTELHDLSR